MPQHGRALRGLGILQLQADESQDAGGAHGQGLGRQESPQHHDQHRLQLRVQGAGPSQPVHARPRGEEEAGPERPVIADQAEASSIRSWTKKDDVTIVLMFLLKYSPISVRHLRPCLIYGVIFGHYEPGPVASPARRSERALDWLPGTT